MKRTWIYDIETLINCFVAVFIDRDSDEKRVFIMHTLQDDLSKLYRFLHEEVEELIGYNCIDFDDKVLKWIIDSVERGILVGPHSTYQTAQEIISGVGFSKPTGIPNRDLYRLHHFDNVAKATSLKWLQCHLGMDNIQDMPIDHDQVISTWEDIRTVVLYCENDVVTTKKLLFYGKTQELIEVRDEMMCEYRLPGLRNMSNASMGERILLEYIPGALESTPLKPDPFSLSKVILPFIRFHTSEFRYVLDKMKDVVIDPGYSAGFSIDTVSNGMKYSFGLGGLHGARPKSFWNNIITMDVESYYPRLSVEHGFFPRHLGPRFIEGYDKLFQNRKATVKGTNKNKALKEALNSAFGKSNSEYSKLYDPMMTFAITVNGQLLLAMLCEAVERLNAGKVVMANTDGIEVQVYDESKLMKITGAWQTMTRLNLEFDTYSHLLIRDVNNYIGKFTSGKIKMKGAYEIDKELHKDPSARIVPTVICDWFANDCRYPVEFYFEKYMKQYDLFFMYARAKTGKFTAVSKDGTEVIELPKTIRYIITDTGYVLRKETTKKSEKVHSDKYVSLFNNIRSLGVDTAEIDYGWYLREIKSLTDFGVAKLSLF